MTTAQTMTAAKARANAARHGRSALTEQATRLRWMATGRAALTLTDRRLYHYARLAAHWALVAQALEQADQQ